MAAFKKVKAYLTSLLKKELSPDLFYHGPHHTSEVYQNAIEIAKAEKINRKDLTLLKTAVLLHDAGFTKKYKGHEQLGCKMAKTILPKYEYSKEDIKKICSMIRATEIPQQPKNLLENILADADLKYLGTNEFKKTGQTLFEEWKIFYGPLSESDWNRIQINFLQAHHYHTDYCKKKYEKTKQKNLKKLIQSNDKIK